MFFKTVWKIQYPIMMAFKISFIFLIPIYLLSFLKNRKITFELMVITIVFTASVLQAIVTYGTNSRHSFPFEYLMVFVVFMFLKSARNKYFKKGLRLFLLIYVWIFFDSFFEYFSNIHSQPSICS